MEWTHDCATLLGDNVLHATAQTFAYVATSLQSLVWLLNVLSVTSRDE